MEFRAGETAGWIRAGCVLDILAMLGNQGGTQLCELLPKLWDNLGPDELFNGSFGAGVRVDIYVELGTLVDIQKRPWGMRRRTTYSFSSVSCATSGTVIVPVTSSSSLVLPGWSAEILQT